eukprot:TRINITY_DN9577_c0_g1_i15.p1 TRINITY_DN9577_c0_g1~~TRINITY_DN9577_c0_g1_i15.p1  ORF type:complete len:123 (+),score=15.94 TRINITY_DN9577_c0_g1_i15:248-616(+)
MPLHYQLAASEIQGLSSHQLKVFVLSPARFSGLLLLSSLLQVVFSRHPASLEQHVEVFQDSLSFPSMALALAFTPKMLAMSSSDEFLGNILSEFASPKVIPFANRIRHYSPLPRYPTYNFLQ